jgi:hypothetical protein
MIRLTGDNISGTETRLGRDRKELRKRNMFHMLLEVHIRVTQKE